MKNPKNTRHFKITQTLLLTTLAGISGLAGCKPHEPEKAPSASQAAHVTVYQCPMHHQIILSHPGTCPICGMVLVPVGDGGDSIGQDHSAQASMSSVVRIDPAVVQNMGVRTEIVQRRLMASEVRLEGKIVADESRVRSVTAHVAGYVEKLYASISGQGVRQGEPLLELYSPDLVSAQQEFIGALGYREGLPEGSPLIENADDLVESSRRRLLNWGVSETFIKTLKKTRQVERSVPLPSPITGVLARKSVIEGQAITPGMELFQIADLSQVWVAAHVYQQDLTSLRIGSSAALTFQNLPGRKFTASVFFIAPEMDPTTRTVELRLKLPNTPGMDFRPEMFAEVLLRGPADSALAIPEQAVIRSGTREIAVVSLGDGRFEPREIHTGKSADGYVEVLDGLSKDQSIVVSAQFLIDSESNLRAAIGQMQAGAESSDTSAAGGGHAR